MALRSQVVWHDPVDKITDTGSPETDKRVTGTKPEKRNKMSHQTQQSKTNHRLSLLFAVYHEIDPVKVLFIA